MLRYLLTILCALTLNAGFAEKVIFSASVLSEDSSGPISMAEVFVISDGISSRSYISSKTGEFSFTLDYDHRYQLRIEKKGFYTKVIEVNTNNVPGRMQKQHFEINISVSLIKEIPDLDLPALTFGSIFFSKSEGNKFVVDQQWMATAKENFDSMLEAECKRRGITRPANLTKRD